MSSNPLQENMVATYNSLRFGMFVLAAATPIIIVLWGFLFGVPWQNSISAYYFAPHGNTWTYSYYPCRVLFVGVLFAIGTFLYLYKGLSRAENIALNFAGLFALGVALCPMYAEMSYIPSSNIMHFTFAVLLFLCMAYTAIFCNKHTLKYLEKSRRARYRATYRIIGWFMALFPVVGIILAFAFEAMTRQIYWIEAAGIWAFAAFWFVKSRELRQSQVETKATTGTLPLPPPDSD